ESKRGTALVCRKDYVVLAGIRSGCECREAPFGRRDIVVVVVPDAEEITSRTEYEIYDEFSVIRRF
ncbi:MAG: hypothetical protein IKJ45_03770, partial [Kiritimatiellae bacterium]|nr:hypothetical protein [Kiritimatiellia bacterium]